MTTRDRMQPTPEQWAWLCEHMDLVRAISHKVVARLGYRLSSYANDVVHDAAMDAAIRVARNYKPGRGSPGSLLGLAIARDVNKYLARLRRGDAESLSENVPAKSDVLMFADAEQEAYAELKLAGYTDSDIRDIMGWPHPKLQEVKSRVKKELVS